MRRHERKVRAFLSRLCRGQGADDLAQETFLKAWRVAASWRAEGSYEGWLLRIAWRLFLTERRRARPERDLDAAAEGAAERVDTDLRLDLDRALGRLPDRERAAALLCLGDGYTHVEAADILDLPLGTLKSVVARARSELALQLEGHGR